MMKKQAFQNLLLLLPFLLCPLTFFANDPGVVPAVGIRDGGCPGPAPNNLQILDLQPTSVTLAWDAVPLIGQAYVNYRVEGYDYTDNVALPAQYTVNNSFSYPVKPGHTVEFSVGSSYCPGGEVGMVVPTGPFVIPTIIITQVIELTNPCTPSNVHAAGGTFDFCVNLSANQTPPFTSGVVCLLEVTPGDLLMFGLAATGSRIYIGQRLINDHPNSNYQFQPIGQDEDKVLCYSFLGQQAIFLVEVVDATPTSNNEIKMRLTFYQQCTSFMTCNTECGPLEADPHGTDGRSETITNSGADVSVSTIETPSPNPFNDYVSFQYTLAQTGPVNITLYDPMGRLVRSVETTDAQDAGEYNVTIDGNDLPEGMYYLHVLTGEIRKVFPLVKRR